MTIEVLHEAQWSFLSIRDRFSPSSFQCIGSPFGSLHAPFTGFHGTIRPDRWTDIPPFQRRGNPREKAGTCRGIRGEKGRSSRQKRTHTSDEGDLVWTGKIQLEGNRCHGWCETRNPTSGGCVVVEGEGSRDTPELLVESVLPREREREDEPMRVDRWEGSRPRIQRRGNGSGADSPSPIPSVTCLVARRRPQWLRAGGGVGPTPGRRSRLGCVCVWIPFGTSLLLETVPTHLRLLLLLSPLGRVRGSRTPPCIHPSLVSSIRPWCSHFFHVHVVVLVLSCSSSHVSTWPSTCAPPFLVTPNQDPFRKGNPPFGKGMEFGFDPFHPRVHLDT